MRFEETTNKSIKDALEVFENLESKIYNMYLMRLRYVQVLGGKRDVNFGFENIKLAADYVGFEAIEKLINMYTYGI